MNRFTWLLAFALVLLVGSIATRAQFEVTNRAFHSNTMFPLTGRHQTVACESCHLKGVFKGTPTACVDCHWVRRQDDKFKTQLGTQCENCHRTISWAAVRWDHAAMTGMSLNGAHRTVGCEACHTNNNFKSASVSCITCHQKDYDATKVPNHAAAGFPTACEACHKPSDIAFSQARFDHNTRFPLTGAHATTNCASCHKGNVYRGTSSQCASCHQADFTRAQNPNHVAAGFPQTCELCHKPNQPTWQGTPGSAFNHSSYPLTGQHTQVTCASCHKNNVFQGTPRDCVGCHRTNYERTTTPNHAAAGFPTTCESCHRTSDIGWKTGGAGFNHNQYFTLVGVHQLAQCATCHKNNVYKGTARDCAGCHLPKYQATTKPNHAQSGFSTSCELCHRPTDVNWNNGSFNHTATYPLVGQHATVDCAVCHKNNVYKGTSRDCVGCHKAQYDATTTPNHARAGIPTTCENCHRPTDSTWKNGNFNHNSVFPLVGKHAAAQCAVCHVSGVFKGTARDCVGCHRTDYDRTSTPNHASAGFSTQCESCHKATDSSWKGVAFNHNQFFSLVGKHAAAQCATCHVNGVYKGTARDCVGCHRTLYDRTTKPNHASAGFSTQCESCHKATDGQWTGVAFNHNQFFSLVGKHAAAQCATCHVNGVYKGTSTTCVGCHKPLYDRTTAPNHASAGFSTSCESCHKATDNQWTGVVFNHSQFFALQGKHATVTCATCHGTGVYKGTPTTCVGCHLSKYNATTNPNHITSGFSTTCETCHRATDTLWTQGRFTHTKFPLTGNHNVSCVQCHTTNAPPVFNCLQCHIKSTTDAKHRGNNGYRYDSAACYSCHPNGRAG